MKKQEPPARYRLDKLVLEAVCRLSVRYAWHIRMRISLLHVLHPFRIDSTLNLFDISCKVNHIYTDRVIY